MVQQLSGSAGRVAVATAVSRLTGFVRTVLLAAALGVTAVADAYNGANTFPNMVYALLLGGVLSSVVVPILARSRLRGANTDELFVQRFLSAATVVALAITVAITCAAPWLSAVFVTDPDQRHITTIWAYCFLPQVFFYAIAALITAVLNARDRFAAPSWAPVLNNVVVIATVGVFFTLPGPTSLSPTSITGPQLAVLGAGTTLGIICQAAWCVILLRRSGFHWRWRVRIIPYTWRPLVAGLRITAWMAVYVIAAQAGVAVVTRVAFDHGSVSAYVYADLLFQMPFGIVAISILTVLTPRLSRAISANRTAYLRSDLRTGGRYLLALLIPIAGLMAVLAPTAATLVFTGRISADDARLIGLAVAVSSFGLPLLALVMLQLRAFYGAGDTRTPALLNVVMVATKLLTVYLGLALVPAIPVVVLLCVSGSISYLIGAALGHLALRRRHGLLGFRRVAETGARAFVLTIATAIPTGVAVSIVASTTSPLATEAAALVTIAVALLVATATFSYLMRIVRIPEIRFATRLCLSLIRH